MKNTRALLVLFAALAVGCGDDQADPSSAAAGTTGGSSATKTPHFADLIPEQLNVIKPGGDTICGRGTEYAFFVVPGDKNRVILDFEGGGACWDDLTCSFANAIFKESVNVKDYMNASAKVGFYDRANPAHPLKGWTHVYVPYCTGDVHWGDSVKSYGSGNGAVTIHHKGSVNVRAVLAWMYAELAAPEKVFVTGCSAGGYGSIWWAPEVQHHYEKARVYHFADSAAGVITKDFFEKSFPAWNAQQSFPAFLGDYKKASKLPALYNIIAAYYPKNTYSQYNTVFDENQTFYYVAMGGKDKFEWSGKMKANVKEIEGASPGFRAFLPEGEQHCILPFDNFYTAEAGGKKLTAWLSDMVNDKPVESAYCADCKP